MKNFTLDDILVMSKFTVQPIMMQRGEIFFPTYRDETPITGIQAVGSILYAQVKSAVEAERKLLANAHANFKRALDTANRLDLTVPPVDLDLVAIESEVAKVLGPKTKKVSAKRRPKKATPKTRTRRR